MIPIYFPFAIKRDSFGQSLVEEGVEARLAAADVSAADLAEEARIELLDRQGDANRAVERRANVAEVAAGESE